MRTITQIVALVFLGPAVALSFLVDADAAQLPRDDGQTQPKDLPVIPKVYKGDGWAIAAPDNWSAFDAVRPPVVLYLSGDGQQGIPLFDGTLSVLMAGLQVEVFPKGELSLKEHVAKDVKELKTSGAFELIGDPKLEDVMLADSTPATVLDAEFVRLQNGRVSMQCKVYCADARGRHIVVSSFVTCSRPGRQSVKALSITVLLRTNATSLVLDPEKQDASTLLAAYEKHNWDTGVAMEQVSKGNDLLAEEKFAEAAITFREAIKVWDHLSAAHNGLAWSLLHASDSKKEDLEEALSEAQLAVKQTEELDVSSLDTLALAYDRNKDREHAIQTIKQALAIEPKNPELQARLKSLE